MKRTSGWLPWCVIAVFLACITPLSRGATPDSACVANAGASLNALERGDFSAARRNFSASTASELPATKIRQAWLSVQQVFGAYRGHGEPHRQSFHGRPVVVTHLTLAGGPLDFVVGCDAAHRITLFAFLNPSVVEAHEPEPIQAHVLAGGVRVEPLDVPSPAGPMRGALTLPAGKGPFPAVVLVWGSGNIDMDETVGPDKPFRDLAEGLAKAGIASLRFDKRGFDHPQETAAEPDFTVDDEETDDALTAARMIAKRPGIAPHRVFVLGHSEGAMLAPRIARRDPGLAGIIMMAAPARPLLDVLAGQIRSKGQRTGTPAAAIARQEKAIRSERALLAKADPKHPPKGRFMFAPQGWWLSVHDYDQVAVAKSLSLPMLILQGGNDIQVSPTRDFDAWKKALAGKPDVTFHLYPGLSHLFMPGPTRSAADYEKPYHMDSGVIRDIAGWIRNQPPAK